MIEGKGFNNKGEGLNGSGYHTDKHGLPSYGTFGGVCLSATIDELSQTKAVSLISTASCDPKLELSTRTWTYRSVDIILKAIWLLTPLSL